MLFEAIEELEKDEFIQNSLGNHVANKYIEAKKEEWNKFDYLLAQKILKERGKEINKFRFCFMVVMVSLINI